MGKIAQQLRHETIRTIRTAPLTDAQRKHLEEATYEGSPFHKRNPGDFGLTPPAAPRPDKTLCDEAGIFKKVVATRLFKRGIKRALVSEYMTPAGFPKEFWVVDSEGNVFEAMYGGTRDGAYHGYPIRRSDPLFEKVSSAWKEKQ
ncbi:MAG: hypothetical protein RBU25_16220 [Lentisphaeria bacterium]|jgi:hypothetical protein|nr:hypothetical protein [Lentisphaeria bacterium]